MTKLKPTERRSIDWPDIHRRLDKVQQVLASGAMPGADEVGRILAARARSLAKPVVVSETGDELEVIEFILSGEHYGLEFAFVREVFPISDLTPVPCTPNFVLGIVNVRGEIVSVIDLRKFFELPEAGLTDLNRVIILRSPAMTFGILADAVSGVRSVGRHELQASLPTLNGRREDYLLGVTAEPLIVLDAARLLADPRMVVEESIEA